MNAGDRRIDEYVRAVARHLVGSADEKAAATAELMELLSDAAEAGELDGRLARLGTPEDAARSFSRDRTRPLAPVGDRFIAAALDNLPLIVFAVLLFAQGMGAGAATLAFPPFVYIEVAGGCVALAPTCGVYNGGALYGIGLPIALGWSILGLALLESWLGGTPGKRVMKLRVVSEDGLRLRPYAAVIRRLSFLVGPIAWADWVPALWGDRQRVMDKVSAAKVVRTTAISADPVAGTEGRKNDA